MSRAREQANLSSDSNIFVDIANDRTGIGVTTPSQKLEIAGNIKLGDNQEILIGTGSDLKLWHDGTHSYIRTTSGTQNLYLQTTNGQVILGEDGGHIGLYYQAGGTVELRYDNSKKIETTSSGATVTGDITISDKIIHAGDTNTAIRFPSDDTVTVETGGTERLRIDSGGVSHFGGDVKLVDSKILKLGNSSDLQISHDGNNSAIKDLGTGVLFLDSDGTGIHMRKSDGTNMAKFNTDGAVELYESGNKKFETTSAGAKVTGNLEVTGVLTYDDVTNIDSVGIVTARTGIHIDDSITHIGDTNTKIRFPAADTITAETGGSERLRITSGGDIQVDNGNVHIDDNGEFAIFEQDTALAMTNSSKISMDFASNVARIRSSHNGSGGNAVSRPLAFFIGSSEKLRIDSSGRVLIGGTSNSASSHADELQVINTSAEGGISIINGTSSTGHIYFGDTDASAQGRIDYNHGGDYMRLYTANTERLRIASDGHIAIGGYGDPASILDVRENKDGAETQIRLYNTDNGDTTTQTAAFYMSPDSRGAAYTGIRAIKENASFATNAGRDIALSLNVTQNNSQVEGLRITSGGRVNIGQATDTDHVLCVAGTDAATDLTTGHSVGIQLQNKSTTDDTYSQIEWRTAAGGRYARIIGIQDDANGNGGQLSFLTENSSGTISERLRITSDGNMGLGTDDPNGKLHISSGTANSDCLLIIESDTDNNDENSNPQIWFKQDGDKNLGFVGQSSNKLVISNNVDSSGGISFRTGTTNNSGTTDPLNGSTERLTIDSSGHLKMPEGSFDIRVGDNTDSNAGTQTISVGSMASGKSGGIQIWANSTNGNSFIQFGDGTASADHYRGFINYRHADNGLRFGTDGSDRVIIDSAGKVKIGGGTASLALLHIGPADYSLNLQNNSSNESKILFTKNGTPNDARAWIKGNGELNGYIKFGAGDADRVTIQSTGELTVGTSTGYGGLSVSKRGGDSINKPFIEAGQGATGGDFCFATRYSGGQSDYFANIISTNYSSGRSTYGHGVRGARQNEGGTYYSDNTAFVSTHDNFGMCGKAITMDGQHTSIWGELSASTTSVGNEVDIKEFFRIDNSGVVTINPRQQCTSGYLYVKGTSGGTAGIMAGGSTGGNDQCTGYMEVNQDGVHGGGMMYNGDGSPAFATGESSDQFSLYRNHNGTRHVVAQWPYDSNDSTFKGNMNIDNGTSTLVRVTGNSDGTAGVSCGGDSSQSQCTGYVEVHQDRTHGGGISYNGDGSPSFVNQEGSDRITFWRMQAGTRQEVFSYPYSDNSIRFRGDLRPASNNAVDLGSNSIRWRDVYCNQGAFNNSDETLKQDIASLTTAEMNVAKRLSGLFKTYRWKDAVVKKGTDKARTHTGIIAQQIVAAMEAEGIDYTKYGFIGYGEWYENDEGEVIELDKADDSNLDGYTKVGRYSVRYTELLSFIAAYNDQRFVDLETRVAALESA